MCARGANCLKIIKAKGGNDYEQHRTKAEKEAQERAAKRQKK